MSVLLQKKGNNTVKTVLFSLFYHALVPMAINVSLQGVLDLKASQLTSSIGIKLSCKELDEVLRHWEKQIR